MAISSVLFILQTIFRLILVCGTNTKFWAPFLCISVPSWVLIVRTVRYHRVNKIKRDYAFTNNLASYNGMMPDVAQVVMKNLAEWDFPFVFEFGWISEFFKVSADRGAHGSSPLTRVHQLSLVPVFRASLFGITRERYIQNRLPYSQSATFSDLSLLRRVWLSPCMPFFDDAHMYLIASWVRSVTRGNFFLTSLLPDRATPSSSLSPNSVASSCK